MVGCGDPSPIGTGVLDGERLNIQYTDTLGLSAKTIDADPLTSYRFNLDIRDRILGQLDDPLTGVTGTELYARLRLSSAEPEFEGAVIDSVILVLAYDSLGFYGDRGVTQEVEVYQLADMFPDVDTLASDVQLPVGNLIGSKTLIPSFNDSILITSYIDDTLISLSPQLRIPLDNNIGQQILDNPDLLTDDTTFAKFFPGVVLKSTPSGSATFGLNMSRSQNSGGLNSVKLYYNIGDTTKGIYNLLFSNDISSYIFHERAGYPLADFIEDEQFGDSILVVQGLSGVNTSVAFDDLSSVSADVINYAELICFINDDTGVDPDNYFPRNVVTSKVTEDGTFLSTNDFSVAISSGRLNDLYGGNPQDTVVNGVPLQFIKVNVTGHIKEVLDDPSIEPRIVFSVASNVQIPGRTVFYGPGHSLYPMKLRIIFTDIN
jgi:hypothetical protein